MSTTRAELLGLIERAFDDAVHPGVPANILDVPCCDDHDSAAVWLSQHTWQEFSDKLIDDDCDPTVLVGMSTSAYVYFLPAILRYIVECSALRPEWGKRCWRPVDWIFYLLLPHESGLVRACTKESSAEYSHALAAKQRECVAVVLTYAVAAGLEASFMWEDPLVASERVNRALPRFVGPGTEEAG